MEKKKKCKKNLTLVGFEPAACGVESHIATYLTTKPMHSGACKLMCYCNCYFITLSLPTVLVIIARPDLCATRNYGTCMKV